MATPVLNIADFRANFTEFANETKYPDSLLNLYWRQVVCMIEEGNCAGVGCGECAELHMELLLAHLLRIHTTTITRGKQGGFVNSSTVDKVSVSRVAPPAADMFEWWLGQTPYGQQLLAMLQIDTVGGFSIGGLPEREAFRKVGGTWH